MDGYRQAEDHGTPHWVLVSTGRVDDRWAWSGIPESLARALRRRGQVVTRVSTDLPAPVERHGARLARRIPGHAVMGHDSPVLVRWRSARLSRQAPGWPPARIVAFGSTFTAPRVDATFEDMTVAQHPELPESSARERWKQRQGRIYRGASWCFTSTEWAARSIRDDYGQPGDKIVVAGFGPNVECRPVAKDWSNPRLLWVGVDWDRKGGELLLRAFQAAAIPGATLDLVGRHPNVDTPGVVGHGVIREPERLAAMFERATLFVLPSRFDASPIVLLEAAAAGTPLIASATGGTPEHVGDAGLTVSPGNLGGLVQAMRHAASPEAAARFRDAALAQARVRTWDSAAARMIESFELNGGPPAR